MAAGKLQACEQDNKLPKSLCMRIDPGIGKQYQGDQNRSGKNQKKTVRIAHEMNSYWRF
ncbi:MAG: hypothetical protein R3C56_19850 [Pirellulaceae bacterium]